MLKSENIGVHKGPYLKFRNSVLCYLSSVLCYLSSDLCHLTSVFWLPSFLAFGLPGLLEIKAT
jgi:hypothetical protein